jgi:hypothetical protein
VVDYFSALVDFKDESVVDLIFPKDLDVYASGHDNEYNDESKDVSLNS